MDTGRSAIIDGPNKPALQSSLANTGAQYVYFCVKGDAFNAQILRMDEEVDGFTCRVHGRLKSGRTSGVPFRSEYSVGTRSGWFAFHSTGGANNG